MRIQLKPNVGSHSRQEGKTLRTYRAGEYMEIKNYDEIPVSCRDKFIFPENWDSNKTMLDDLEKPPVNLVIEHKGGGRYNVVNSATGIALNDAYLTQAEAEAMAPDAVLPIKKRSRAK